MERTSEVSVRGYFNREEFVNRLHEFGYSQSDFADKVGVTPAYISAIKCGKAGPSSALLTRMAAMLGCNVRDLWTYPGEKKYHVDADNITDSHTLILDSLRIIRGVCKEHVETACAECPLGRNGVCLVFESKPNEWKVTDRTEWSAFK